MAQSLIEVGGLKLPRKLGSSDLRCIVTELGWSKMVGSP